MCKHEQICIECTREEIAKLEKQIDELKKKLPDVIYIQTPQLIPIPSIVPYMPIYPTPQIPYWYNQIQCATTNLIATNQ